MTLALHYAAGSDVGLLRQGNEDAAYAGARLLAVADGMGGHAAGEVASAAAIATLEPLDSADGQDDAVATLRQSFLSANQQLRDMVTGDRSLEGMGTTVTALLADGPRLALAHIGDSRAYLWHDGRLDLLTHDHTYVQSLVDQGRLRPEDAETHPQRSLLTRALDGRPGIDVDVAVRELRVGDRYLLCTDGLSGVVSEADMAEALALPDPAEAVRQLISMALAGGAPDNVTCVVADVVDADPPAAAPQAVGAAAKMRVNDGGEGGAAVATRAPVDAASNGGRPRRKEPVRAGEPDPLIRSRQLRRRRAALLAVLAGAVLVATSGGAWAYVRSQYYVAAHGEEVAIFRGVEGSFAGISLSSVHSRPGLPLEQLPRFERDKVRQGIHATGLGHARRIVDQLMTNRQAPR